MRRLSALWCFRTCASRVGPALHGHCSQAPFDPSRFAVCLSLSLPPFAPSSPSNQGKNAPKKKVQKKTWHQRKLHISPNVHHWFCVITMWPMVVNTLKIINFQRVIRPNSLVQVSSVPWYVHKIFTGKAHLRLTSLSMMIGNDDLIGPSPFCMDLILQQMILKLPRACVGVCVCVCVCLCPCVCLLVLVCVQCMYV